MLFKKRKIKEVDLEVFAQELKEVINEAEQELANRKKGFSGDCTVSEIEDWILPELYHYYYLASCRLHLFHKDKLECVQLFNEETSESKMASLILQIANKYNL